MTWTFESRVRHPKDDYLIDEGYPTFIVSDVIGASRRWSIRCSEAVQPMIGDLKDPSTVDQTVGRFQVPVGDDLALVQEYHSLSNETDNVGVFPKVNK